MKASPEHTATTETRNIMALEKGAASLRIELRKGTITVNHGTDDIELMRVEVVEGTWDAMFKAIGDALLTGYSGIEDN
jgi:hypothetical protein